MTATVSPEKAGPETAPTTSRRGDRVFAAIARTAAFTILVALVAVFVFLAIEGWSGFTAAPAVYAPFTSFTSYIWPLVVSTAPGLGDRGDRRGAVRDRDRAVHLPLRAAAGWRPRSPT